MARQAEECGFESFYTSEHIVMYPGAMLPGYVALPPDLAVADPLACLTYVAGATRTLLLGTAVLLVPYYQPILLAKQLATIDVLSRGRMSRPDDRSRRTPRRGRGSWRRLCLARSSSRRSDRRAPVALGRRCNWRELSG